MDERFKMHRYYSTRLATLVGVGVMAVMFYYDLFANHQVRSDLVIILGAMALAKLGATIYYRLTN